MSIEKKEGQGRNVQFSDRLVELLFRKLDTAHECLHLLPKILGGRCSLRVRGGEPRQRD